ncbi:substrate-binding domain-containing protein [Microbacterium sp. M3]|uniref:Substrate-binding domain-containing protein n=1 Tax=Microbacterium arthrosphaerae TaxID=792652 RepID=A0ABU4H2Y0_9MICO|nr:MULTISPECIES: substrate-binding domain-containing protein [Microbacterium]MDW4573687.1 substrate-binding domain-containing protein [Microbacterium arthrosphaerae]MDW7607542.1 substrate-binding domain-containing protein [Microbacterium sp. M3]
MDQPSDPRAFGLSRREHILDELRRTGAVRVTELARQLGVSELTVRRDIGQLADRGLVTRVHGGATLRSRLDTTVPGAAGRAPIRFRVGMVVPSLSYYWPHVIIGARAAATDLGVQLVLRGASYSVDDQRRQIASLVDAGSLHGLIVAPETLEADGRALLHWLEALPIPVVLAERRAASALALTRLEWVTTDHVFGGSLAADHLASLGHRRVGILTSAGSPTSWQLRRGWNRAVAELGLECPVDVDATLDAMDGVSREELIGDVLGRCRTTGTTALLIHNDPQAVLLQQYAHDHGWTVPDDLAIVAYDDEVAESAEPAITALRPPKQQVGRLAVETMVARLTEGARRPVQRVLLLPALLPRGSTARPAS